MYDDEADITSDLRVSGILVMPMVRRRPLGCLLSTPRKGEMVMLVPFGTKVIDAEGNAVGTVRYIVLHGETREVTGVVVHQGVLRSREIVVPISKVAKVDHAVQLGIPASDLENLPLFPAEPLRPMPDHWDMPVGFDERAFFMVAGGGWEEAVMPFMRTSAATSGTPAYVVDKDSARDAQAPDIGVGTRVYDSVGQHIGDVESVGVNPASHMITWIVVRRGHLFRHDTTIPASLIGSVTDHVTLKTSAEAIRRLEFA